MYDFENTRFDVLMLKDGRWELIETCVSEKSALAVAEGERGHARGLRVSKERYVPAFRNYKSEIVYEWLAEDRTRPRQVAHARITERVGPARKAPKKQAPVGLMQKLRQMLGL